MEHYKMSKLLNDSTVSKFLTRKRIELNDLSGGQYYVNKNIKFQTPMLRSDLCDYSDAYIVEKGRIYLGVAENNTMTLKDVVFKDNALLRRSMSKINNVFVDNAEDLDIFMLMYNLLGYSDNYSLTSGNLWNYYIELKWMILMIMKSFK